MLWINIIIQNNVLLDLYLKTL